ncbi:hydantoinase/oxoprolinase family protein [Alcaligenaceae bacterium]|nr:hydantoinase/oxoprolinase family protein [Alcaligenaceae bacterium]
MAEWSIGIDIGGTFTDLVALDYSAGRLHSLKILTTYADPSQAVAEGVQQLMSVCDIQAADVTRVVHATTLFTNALIGHTGARTGLLANHGFMDAIEIGNERKYDLYDLTIDRPPALVPRDMRGGISGRLDARGNELEPLDREEVVEVVRSLVNAGAASIAVCLLHAYASPQHERQVGEWIQEVFPDLSLTLSSDVAPVIREFERCSTTVANAYIKPLADKYLVALERRLVALGLDGGVLMMLSNGGLGHLQEARQNPIELLESGPAGGAIAAAHYGACDSAPNLLAFDMGGTTAKLTLVEDGVPSIAHSFEAARRKRFAEGSGLPIDITTVHLIEIGAGGGSIAYQDELQLLKVGPASAGSEPGPACYARGGEDPTVTDANLLLGYLNAEYFAGGTFKIDKSKAHDSVNGIAGQLDRNVIDVAWGIHDIVAENMAGAARVHLAECGRDAEDFVLLCTGGGGPLHAYYVAQKIGVRSIICPPAAGVASAYGLLIAPARVDRSRTVNFSPHKGLLAEIEREFASLEADARTPLELLDDRFGPIEMTRHADGRFVGQAFNLSVGLPPGPYHTVAGGPSEEQIREGLIGAFKHAYEQKFGRTPPNVSIELVNLRVAAEAPPRTAFTPAPLSSGVAVEPRSWRDVYFKEHDDFIRTPVYERADLVPGFSVNGPVLVEDASSTLVIGPKGTLEQLSSGNISITIKD